MEEHSDIRNSKYTSGNSPISRRHILRFRQNNRVPLFRRSYLFRHSPHRVRIPQDFDTVRRVIYVYILKAERSANETFQLFLYHDSCDIRIPLSSSELPEHIWTYYNPLVSVLTASFIARRYIQYWFMLIPSDFAC